MKRFNYSPGTVTLAKQTCTQAATTKATAWYARLRVLLAAVVALSLALPGLASADHYGHGRYKHNYKHHHGQKKHHRYGHRGHHGKHYRHGGRGYRDKHITHYYKDDDSDEKLLIGLVVGGILGYAINSARHSDTYGYVDRYSAAPPNLVPPRRYPTNDDTCLQEREYQTTVVVGGRRVPAYGTACLQPDGAWQ